MPFLEVKDLVTSFDTDDGIVRAVNGVSYQISPRKTLGVVGESGCGKSVTALSILGLVQPPGRVKCGEILFARDGDVVDLATLHPKGSASRSTHARCPAACASER